MWSNIKNNEVENLLKFMGDSVISFILSANYQFQYKHNGWNMSLKNWIDKEIYNEIYQMVSKTDINGVASYP